jgi:hypothetical protein
VYNLIEHKWTYTQFLFALILFFHVTFVIFLTAYALQLLNPLSPTCKTLKWSPLVLKARHRSGSALRFA